MEAPIRWLQRFESYKKAFSRLKEAVSNYSGTQIEQDGIIQRFEFTFELAWKLLKDYLEFNGIALVRSPAEARQEALKMGLISDGPGWKDMQDGRHRSSHEYDEEKIAQLFLEVSGPFLQLFEDLLTKLSVEADKNHD